MPTDSGYESSDLRSDWPLTWARNSAVIFFDKQNKMEPNVDPAAVEAPHQRGITERHGKTFKFMLMKSMDTFNCESMEEWRGNWWILLR